MVEILGDDRFPSGTGAEGVMDLSVIAFPLLQMNNELYGVVQFVRDAQAQHFQSEDMEIARSYMSWCALTLQYAQLASQVYIFCVSTRLVKSWLLPSL